MDEPYKIEKYIVICHYYITVYYDIKVKSHTNPVCFETFTLKVRYCMQLIYVASSVPLQSQTTGNELG